MLIAAVWLRRWLGVGDCSRGRVWWALVASLGLWSWWRWWPVLGPAAPARVVSTMTAAVVDSGDAAAARVALIWPWHWSWLARWWRSYSPCRAWLAAPAVAVVVVLRAARRPPGGLPRRGGCQPAGGAMAHPCGARHGGTEAYTAPLAVVALAAGVWLGRDRVDVGEFAQRYGVALVARLPYPASPW